MWGKKRDILDTIAGISKQLTEVQNCVETIMNDLAHKYMQSSIDHLHDRVTDLVKDKDRIKSVALAEKTLDKFEDYMKNVDKLNGMVNEFKGCVSVARAAVADRKQIDQEFNISLGAVTKYVEDNSKENTKKIDHMDKLIRKIAEKLQVCENEAPKTRKRVKKVPASPAA
jgi:uncharacterized coiled-coil protein SlyX